MFIDEFPEPVTVRHSGLMAEVLALPRHGETFLDARDCGRTMRVSHHPERGLIVVSLWPGRCAAPRSSCR